MKTWKVYADLVKYRSCEVYASCELVVNCLTCPFVQVKGSLFPCKLSPQNIKLAEEAVQLAVKTWGQRSLSELEAEERLSYSCEKVMKLKRLTFFLMCKINEKIVYEGQKRMSTMYIRANFKKNFMPPRALNNLIYKIQKKSTLCCD